MLKIAITGNKHFSENNAVFYHDNEITKDRAHSYANVDNLRKLMAAQKLMIFCQLHTVKSV